MSPLPPGDESMAEIVATFRRRREVDALTAVDAAADLVNLLPDPQLRVMLVLTLAFGLHPTDTRDLAVR